MNFQHINVKIFHDGELTVDLERFIEVFHRWVADQSTDDMLIDVADYRHMHHGPGVVLVGLEVDYSIDHTGGRYGLRFNQKSSVEGSNQDRIQRSYEAAKKACTRLEEELPGLKFNRSDIQVWINDRALAPNNPEVRTAIRKELTTFADAESNGAERTIELDDDERRLVSAQLRW